MDDTAIVAALRTRSLLQNEVGLSVPMTFEFDGSIPQVMLQNKQFQFDFVFEPGKSNAEVYKSAVAPKIENIFKGYNVTIIAYGSTGSGKTYTMGTDCNEDNGNIGIIPLGIEDIFKQIEMQKSEKAITMKVSFMEIYFEVIYDLLNENAQDQKNPVIQEKDGSCKVVYLTETMVKSAEEAFALLRKGSGNRRTSATAKNMCSSRSHAIFTLLIEQVDIKTSYTTCAKFQLVDLAGAERLSTSNTKEKQMKEGIKINVSLLTLSTVLKALSENWNYIPYRDSKLTRVLQDSLGGNSYTLMIVCVNPSATSIEETMSTLRYATNARQIQNKPKVNMDPPDVQIKKLQQKVILLENKLHTMEKNVPLSNFLAYNSKSEVLFDQFNLEIESLKEKNDKIKTYKSIDVEDCKRSIKDIDSEKLHETIASKDERFTIQSRAEIKKERDLLKELEIFVEEKFMKNRYWTNLKTQLKSVSQKEQKLKQFDKERSDLLKSLEKKKNNNTKVEELERKIESLRNELNEVEMLEMQLMESFQKEIKIFITMSTIATKTSPSLFGNEASSSEAKAIHENSMMSEFLKSLEEHSDEEDIEYKNLSSSFKKRKIEDESKVFRKP